MLADTLRDACIDNVGIGLDPNDLVGELLACRDTLTEHVALLELLCDLDVVDVCVKAGVLLRETLTLREGDGRLPDCVALLERLDVRLAEPVGEALTERDGVRLNPKELLRDGLAGFDGETVVDLVLVPETVIDTITDGDAENEHDLNKGLHDRVTLADAGLLRDILMLGDCDFDIPN